MDRILYAWTKSDMVKLERILTTIKKNSASIPKSDLDKIEKAVKELTDLSSKNAIYIDIPMSRFNELSTKDLVDYIKKHGKAIVVFRNA